MTHMQKAISLARNVLGTTSPNPAVGAVLVKDGVEVGSGATLPPGQSHAEIGALELAREASFGSSLYTTLEPCCTYGRTPPCTQAIIDAGVNQIHIATIDPNPKVSGKGCVELKAAGIEVVVGEEAESAKELYEAFNKHIKTGMPFVIAKYAMSLDGKIATHTGDSKWVTGPESRSMVQQLRHESDAVLVGVNTLLADDPLLTARDNAGNALPRQPLRVIVDSRCRAPSNALIFKQPGPILIATTKMVNKNSVDSLEMAGAEVLRLPSDQNGRVSIAALLEELGGRGVVSLLVEGGGAVLGSLFDDGLVDKVYAFLAPVIIGGAEAASPVEGQGADHIAKAWKIERANCKAVGPDWLVVGYPALGN